jgi:aminoglycoside phosphotransferase (APT) family kinase protein
VKHRWIGLVRPQPIAEDELGRIAGLTFPGVDPASLIPLTGGFRGSTYRVGAHVLRIHAPGDESAYKERRLAESLQGVVRTPRCVDVTRIGTRVVAIRDFVAGEPLHEILQRPTSDLAPLGRQLGEVLAKLHAIGFDRFGDLDGNLAVAEPFDMRAEGFRAYVEAALASNDCAARLGPDLVASLRALLARSLPLLDAWSGSPVLVHGDFGPTNLVVEPDGAVSVIDWEFASSARPGLDFANLLRPPLETEANFRAGLQQGYEAAGGRLPSDWIRLALLTDVIAWVEMAARPGAHNIVVSDARARIRRAVGAFA